MNDVQLHNSSAVTSPSTANSKKQKNKTGKKKKSGAPITSIDPSVGQATTSAPSKPADQTLSAQQTSTSGATSRDQQRPAEDRPIIPLPKASKNKKKKAKREQADLEAMPEAGPSSTSSSGKGKEKVGAKDETRGDTMATPGKKRKRKAEDLDITDADGIAVPNIEGDDRSPASKIARIEQALEPQDEARAAAGPGPSSSKYFAQPTTPSVEGINSPAQTKKEKRAHRKSKSVQPPIPSSDIAPPTSEHPNKTPNPLLGPETHLPPTLPPAAPPQQFANHLQAQQKAYQTEQRLKEMIRKKEEELEGLKRECEEAQKEVERRDLNIASQQKTIEAVKEAVTCGICYEIFRQPHSVNPCGHTACAPCFYAWFSSENSLVHPLPPDGAAEFQPFEAHASKSRKCMTCQTQIKAAPAVNYVVLELVEKIKDRLEDEGERDGGAQVARDGPHVELLAALKRVRILPEDTEVIPSTPGHSWANIWDIAFATTFGAERAKWYLDADDHVRRCGGCGFELEGPYCERCELEFSDLEDDDDFMFGEEEADFDWGEEDNHELALRVEEARQAARQNARRPNPLVEARRRANPFLDLEVALGDNAEDFEQEGISEDEHRYEAGIFGIGDQPDIPDETDDEYGGSFINDGEDSMEEDPEEEEEDGYVAQFNPPRAIRAPPRRRGRRAVESGSEGDEVEIVGHGEPVARRRHNGLGGGARDFSPAYNGPDQDIEMDSEDDDEQPARRHRGNRAQHQEVVIDLQSEEETEDRDDQPLTIFSDEEDEPDRAARPRVRARAGRNAARRVVDVPDSDEEEEELAPAPRLLGRLRAATHRARRFVEVEADSEEGSGAEEGTDEGSDNGDE